MYFVATNGSVTSLLIVNKGLFKGYFHDIAYWNVSDSLLYPQERSILHALLCITAS